MDISEYLEKKLSKKEEEFRKIFAAHQDNVKTFQSLQKILPQQSINMTSLQLQIEELKKELEDAKG